MIPNQQNIQNLQNFQQFHNIEKNLLQKPEEIKKPNFHFFSSPIYSPSTMNKETNTEESLTQPKTKTTLGNGGNTGSIEKSKRFDLPQEAQTKNYIPSSVQENSKQINNNIGSTQLNNSSLNPITINPSNRLFNSNLPRLNPPLGKYVGNKISPNEEFWKSLINHQSDIAQKQIQMEQMERFQKKLNYRRDLDYLVRNKNQIQYQQS